MSNLNPGGSRSSAPRAFTARQVADACKRNKVPDVDKPSHSIADKPRTGTREQQRRLRQIERRQKS